ncbi:hypothetical protein OEZ86_009299 [Tetradesmus obliquus]|nr:hypothetical protein OEZ86_009299 [Tetradesmus obliquus]
MFCKGVQQLGLSSDGKQRLRDIQPAKLHQRLPLFMGSPEDMQELMSNTPMNIPNPLKAVVVQEDLGDVQTSSDIFNPMSRPKYQVPSMSYPYTPKGYATVRYPDNNYESQAYDLQYNMLQSVSLKFRPRLSKMFAVGNWREFSNHTTGTASLEGVHDQVHDTLGGNGGHMGYPEVAAFDPIFFLHHANVDRLLALWQVVYDDPSNPATWIQPEEEKAGTFTFPDGSTTDENTPLTPFRKRKQLEDEAGNIDQSDMGAFYTSKGVRSLEHLGYTYPELIEWQAAGLTQAEMLTKINQIYSPSLDYTEGYRLHVNFKGIAKRRLNGPFSINVFVGYDKSDYVVDASTPTKDNPYFAGSVSVFASSNAASNKCANCRHPGRQQVCGSVDLTSALLKVGPVEPAELVEDKLITAETELTWDDLEGKLKDNIQWVAVKPNGAQIHHVAVKDISVTWTRPYNLTEDEQDALIGPMPSEPVQLPAPVANYVAAQNEAGPTALRSAFFAAPKTNRGPVLFVATADLAAPAGPESGGTAA